MGVVRVCAYRVAEGVVQQLVGSCREDEIAFEDFTDQVEEWDARLERRDRFGEFPLPGLFRASEVFDEQEEEAA